MNGCSYVPVKLPCGLCVNTRGGVVFELPVAISYFTGGASYGRREENDSSEGSSGS